MSITIRDNRFLGSNYGFVIQPPGPSWHVVNCPHCGMVVGVAPHMFDALKAEGGTVYCGRGHAFPLDEPATGEPAERGT